MNRFVVCFVVAGLALTSELTNDNNNKTKIRLCVKWIQGHALNRQSTLLIWICATDANLSLG